MHTTGINMQHDIDDDNVQQNMLRRCVLRWSNVDIVELCFLGC